MQQEQETAVGVMETTDGWRQTAGTGGQRRWPVKGPVCVCVSSTSLLRIYKDVNLDDSNNYVQPLAKHWHHLLQIDCVLSQWCWFDLWSHNNHQRHRQTAGKDHVHIVNALSATAHLCKKGICDPSIHKIRYTRLPPITKLALISKTNENLKLLNPCNGNLHNNYNIAKTVGEDSKTNPPASWISIIQHTVKIAVASS